jgi:uncharacterized membrane protein HdeD (DUF308 family)
MDVAQSAATPAEQPRKIMLIVTALRAGLAVTLGVALIFQPDKTRPMLVNFMGMFWLMSGLMGLRWGARNPQQRRRAFGVGSLSALAGLLVLARTVVRGLLDEGFAIMLLAVIMIITGGVHILEGIPNVREGRRQRSRVSLLLGIFELVLGAALLYTPLDIGPIIYWLATTWALLGGFLLFGEALFMWRHMHQQA